jgi:hypothetical protein
MIRSVVGSLWVSLRALSSVVVILLLIGGVPVVLVWLIGNPLPSEIPRLSSVARHLDTGDVPGETMAKFIAVMIWFWWFQLALSMLAEFRAMWRGRTARRLPLAPGVQSVSAKLVASVVLSITALASVPKPAWATSVTVAQGDTLWDLAEEHLGDPERWPEIYAMNRGDQEGGTHLENPDLIQPGWVLEVPIPEEPDLDLDPLPVTRPLAELNPTPLIQPDEKPSPVPVSSDSDVLAPPRSGEEAAADSLPEGELESGIQREAFAAAGLGLLAAGVTVAIRRRRKVQRRRRTPGEHVRRPPEAARDTERRLASIARVQTLGPVGDALLALDSVLEANGTVPVVGISHTPDVTTVLLETQLPAPEPFRTVDEGFGWELAASELEPPTNYEWRGRAPEILITAGWHERSGSEVLLNLEHISHMGIGGTEETVLPILLTMAAELATSPLAHSVEVVCVGFGEQFTELERLRVVPRLADVLAELELVEESSEPLPQMVVLDPYTEDPVALAELHRLAGSQVYAVTASCEPRWRLVCKQDSITVWPVDLRLQRRELDAESIEHLGQVLESASSDEGEMADPGFEAALRDLTLPEPDVEVRVLGAVQVHGIESEFNSRAALAMVAYLAFHRDGATADELKRWIWPADQPPSDKLFANTVSRARVTLGGDANGDRYLPRVGSDRMYRLSDSVGTDVDRFRVFVEAADGDSGAARGFLREALGLVRGLAFAGGDDQPFAWVDHTIRSHIEFMVDETAHRLADEALAAGNAEEVRWAALAGLRLIPDCESCFRRRFLAADLKGNRSEMRRAMGELRRLVSIDADESDSSDLISPELEELYSDLMAGRPVAV